MARAALVILLMASIGHSNVSAQEVDPATTALIAEIDSILQNANVNSVIRTNIGNILREHGVTEATLSSILAILEAGQVEESVRKKVDDACQTLFDDPDFQKIIEEFYAPVVSDVAPISINLSAEKAEIVQVEEYMSEQDLIQLIEETVQDMRGQNVSDNAILVAVRQLVEDAIIDTPILETAVGGTVNIDSYINNKLTAAGIDPLDTTANAAAVPAVRADGNGNGNDEDIKKITSGFFDILKRYREENDKLEKEKIKFIKIGLSLGPRSTFKQHQDDNVRAFMVYDPELEQPVLALEREDDRSAFLLSTSVIFYPFRGTEWTRDRIAERKGKGKSAFGYRLLDNIGFQANLNLVDFSGDSDLSFNKVVPGGIGMAYQFNDVLAFGVSIEWFPGRILKEFYRDFEGQPLLDIEGQMVTTLDEGNDFFFEDETFTGIAFRLIVALNN